MKEEFAEEVETGIVNTGRASQEQHGDIKADDLEEDLLSDQVLTLAILEKSSLRSTSGRLKTEPVLEPYELSDKDNCAEAVINEEVGCSVSRGKDVTKDGGRGSSKNGGSSSFGFGTRNQDSVLKMVSYLLLILSIIGNSSYLNPLKLCY